MPKRFKQITILVPAEFDLVHAINMGVGSLRDDIERRENEASEYDEDDETVFTEDDEAAIAVLEVLSTALRRGRQRTFTR